MGKVMLALLAATLLAGNASSGEVLDKKTPKCTNTCWHESPKESDANELWNEAMAYFRGYDGHEKDWAKARELFLKAGEAFTEKDGGGRLASLGTYFDLKEGPFERDYKQAAKWYKKGADFGNCWCMGKLSVLYRDGKGVEKDLTNALHYARMAADHKLGHYLADYYDQGLGVEQDRAKALELRKEEAAWLNPAWDHGGPSFRVGEQYERGIGTETNLVEAIKWYKKAAMQGSKKARARLESLATNSSLGGTKAKMEDVK